MGCAILHTVASRRRGNKNGRLQCLYIEGLHADIEGRELMGCAPHEWAAAPSITVDAPASFTISELNEAGKYRFIRRAAIAKMIVTMARARAHVRRGRETHSLGAVRGHRAVHINFTSRQAMTRFGRCRRRTFPRQHADAGRPRTRRWHRAAAPLHGASHKMRLGASTLTCLDAIADDDADASTGGAVKMMAARVDYGTFSRKRHYGR